MKGGGGDGPGHLKVVRVADRQALGADWSIADEDQTGSDEDQTGSDEDQTGSDEDQVSAALDSANAASDQQASDEDQASSDRLLAAGDAGALATYEATRLARETSTVRRLAAQAGRTGAAHLRIAAATGRDATAARRDDTARRRDLRAEESERAIAASDAPLAEKLERLRARAATDRARAARDRAYAARERARLETELLEAHLDDLTGAYRREIGTLALTLEIDHARRADGRFVLAFVDVDDLKLVNDRDGHIAGDHVLQAAVQAMRSNLRSFDPVVRYGGDEFVCGIGGTSLEEVARRFDAIDRSLQEEVGVGISVGLVELAEGETLDGLTARADAALLSAKKRRGVPRGHSSDDPPAQRRPVPLR
jgi:diguanylate cyclase (GGDEF)-like protein